MMISRLPAFLLALGAVGPCLADEPAASPASAAEALPSYALKEGRMICRDHLAMELEPQAGDTQAAELTWKGRHYRMRREPTTSGAYHFDDVKGALVVIQIPAKSMLFDKKSMTRLADECNPSEPPTVARK